MPQYLQYPLVERPSPGDIEMPGPRILVSAFNGHRILLPEDGDLILGRFDPESDTHPDIDLTAEDAAAWGISRRHARIIGWRGQYEVEDLGSSNGTRVNDEEIAPSSKKRINTGDEICLGGCVFFLAHPPAIWKRSLADSQCFLYVTFTGHYYSLPMQDVVWIGRSDPKLELHPDIDLCDEDEAAIVVSRRHARLAFSRGQFTIEDIGSTFGTMLNGQKVYAGVKVQIYPGQHLWLGGYTLAFDVIEKPTP